MPEGTCEPRTGSGLVFARGMNEEHIDNAGSFEGRGTSEANARHQHAAWLDYMCGAA